MTSFVDPSGTCTCHSQYAASCSMLTPANASPLPETYEQRKNEKKEAVSNEQTLKLTPQSHRHVRTTLRPSNSMVGADIALEIDRVFPGGGFGFAVISASSAADSSLGQQERQHPMLLYTLIDTKGLSAGKKERGVRWWDPEEWPNGITVVNLGVGSDTAVGSSFFWHLVLAIVNPNSDLSKF